MTDTMRIARWCLMSAGVAILLVSPSQARQIPELTGGVSWGHFDDDEHGALVWTPNELFKVRDGVLIIADEVTVDAPGDIPIPNVEGVTWEPSIDWAPVPCALVWTPTQVFRIPNDGYSATELTVPPGNTSLAGVRGIVWQNWDQPQPWLGPWALIWTDTQLFSYGPGDGVEEVTLGLEELSISGVRGVVWEEWDAPAHTFGPTALIWTDSQLFSYNVANGIAEVTTTPDGDPVPDVQGIAWEYYDPSVATLGPVALIWTPEHLYAFRRAHPTEVSEVSQGIIAPSVPGVRGIAWQDWDPEESPKALIWTATSVFAYTQLNPGVVSKIEENEASISDVQGIAWEPWEGEVGNPFPEPTRALIWTSDRLLQHLSHQDTATEVLEGGASIDGVRGVAWEPYPYDGAYVTEALIWTADRVISHALNTEELLIGGESIPDVRGIAWEFWDGDGAVGATPEALIWTPTHVYHHTSSGIADGEVREDLAIAPLGDVQGIVWESYDPDLSHRALIWTPTKVLWYPYIDFSAQELMVEDESIYSFEPGEPELIQVAVHQAGHHDFEDSQAGLRTSQSGAGVVRAPYTPVGYTGSASAATIAACPDSSSAHCTVQGDAPYSNTTLILGPSPVAGAVTGNAMWLFAFHDPAGIREGDGKLNGDVIRLNQNDPNPFGAATTIAYRLPAAGRVDLRIFDAAGRLIRVLHEDVYHAAGRHEVRWDGNDDAGRQLPAGMYYYRLKAGDGVETKPMVLVRDK